MPFILTTPLAATAPVPSSVTITEGRMRRVTIDIPLAPSAVVEYRIQADWDTGTVVGGEFRVYRRGTDTLDGPDAVDVLAYAAGAGNVGRALERGIWTKLAERGRIPAGAVS